MYTKNITYIVYKPRFKLFKNIHLSRFKFFNKIFFKTLRKTIFENAYPIKIE